MRVTEVVAQQNDFVRRFREPGSLLKRYATEVVASSWSVKDGAQQAKKVAPNVTEWLARAFEWGETYVVTQDMVDLIEFSASRLDETDKIDLDMLPAQWGVVRFERPLILHDIRGVPAKAHWVTWSPTYHEVTNAFNQTVSQRGIIVSWWNDTSDPDAASKTLKEKKVYNPKVIRQLGRWGGFIGADHLGHGLPLGPPTYSLSDELLKAALELDKEMEAAGLNMLNVPPSPDANIDNTQRFLWALILMLDQEIVVDRPPRLSKADVKFMRRMPIWNEVHVIELRARKFPRRDDAPCTVNWSHRWMVRGHWRWQPYADGTVRRIWIHPFIKGPDNAPFIQTKKVYRLSR